MGKMPRRLLKQCLNMNTGVWACHCVPVVWWWWRLHPHWWSRDTALLTSAHRRCQAEYLWRGNPVLPSRHLVKTALSFLNGDKQKNCSFSYGKHQINDAHTNLLWFSSPFFLGPLQITASSGLLRRKPMDITARLSSTYYNKHTEQKLIHLN